MLFICRNLGLPNWTPKAKALMRQKEDKPMLNLLNGPAQGNYMVKRAPLFLRAVVTEVGGAKAKDVLDQLTDAPSPSERVHVYKLQGASGMVHLNMGGARKGSGFYATGEYRHLPDVDGEALRDTAAWQTWCIQNTGAPVNPETGEGRSGER